MGVIERAVAWAKAIAYDDSHGYDQGSRWGPDYDCSSLVISAYKQAGVPLTCTYTGNMKQDMLAHGFRDVTSQVNLNTGAGLQAGDVLLNEKNHTAMYIGNGQIVNAGGNENGGATGGQTGDQTGREIRVMGYYNFPWDCVLRYQEKDDPAEKDTSSTAGGRPSSQGEGNKERTYTVKPGDSLWGIAEREMGNGMLYEDLKRYNNLHDYTIYPGQVLKLPGGGEKPPKEDPQERPKYVTVTVTVTEETLQRWKEKAGSMTLGAYLDKTI